MDYFTSQLDLHLHGVDIVWDEETDRLMVIDCNYLSTYNDVFLHILDEDLQEMIWRHINLIKKWDDLNY